MRAYLNEPFAGGNPKYLSPESRRHFLAFPSNDKYAYGKIFAELLMQNGIEDEAMKELAETMQDPNPESRPSWNEVIESLQALRWSIL